VPFALAFMSKSKSVGDTVIAPRSRSDIVESAKMTGKMANTLAKALAKRYSRRWQFVDFHGPKGHESAGIVDILAIRKCGKPPTISGLKKLDLFDIQLIQVKGGSAANPSAEDIDRMRLVAEHYHADRIVLFQWIKKKQSTYSVLQVDGSWLQTSPAALFGVKS
jgi:hypothetical protein